MRIFVVKDQKSVNALKGELIRAEASTNDVRLAKEALKAANPQIDINKLKTGDVLVIPDDNASFDPGASASVAGDTPDEIDTSLRRQLEALAARLKEHGAEAEEERTTRARSLNELMAEAKKVDEKLIPILEEGLKQVEEESRDEREAKKANDAGIRKAAAELQAVLAVFSKPNT